MFNFSFPKLEAILEGVECGVDVFETSYAYMAAEKGCAVVFSWGQRSGGDRGAELEYDNSCQFEIDLKDTR